MASPSSPGAPGILYFDPNPTTAKLATAGMQLAGYRVLHASTQEQAVRSCRAHGPGGDGSVVAILLDTATSPAVAAATLRALVQVPGAAELPGILLVSRANPTPIPGAEGLPALKRPFTIPALHKLLRESIDDAPRPKAARKPAVSDALRVRLRAVLGEIGVELGPEPLDRLASALVHDATLPMPAAGVALQGNVANLRIESVLQMLANDGVRGVLTVEHADRYVRLHLDQAFIRLAEVKGVEEDLRLGRFIVEDGFLPAEMIEAIASVPDPRGRVLGQRLVDEGQLRPGELAQVLVHQAREVTCHLLGWSEGRLTFAPTTNLHPLAAAVAEAKAELRVAEALLDALRRRYEQAAMGPHMAGVDDVYLRVDTEVAKLGRQAFTREELEVLELLNGRNNVKEIARKTRAGTFAVATVLYRLSRSGLTRRRVEPLQT
jgi:CheY-like chemotaxis protein